MSFEKNGTKDFLTAIAAKQDDSACTVNTDTLSLLFDVQIQTREERGCPQEALKALEGQKPGVIAKASTMYFPRDNLPFLPVIPGGVLPIEEQVKMIVLPGKNNGTKGVCQIKPRELRSLNRAESPYFIYDVENGARLLNNHPCDSRKVFAKSERRGLSIEEMVSLATHSDALLRHNLLAIDSILYRVILTIDSNYEECKYPPSKSPALTLKQGVPYLCGIYNHLLHGKPPYGCWGTPACASLL